MAIYVAVRSFWLEVDGQPHLVRKGATVRGGHPLLDGREAMFRPLTVDYDIEESKKPVRRKTGDE